MSSPEHGGPPDRPDHQPAPEPELTPYLRVSRFAGERPAGAAYFAAQQALFDGPPNDLSAYRFQLNRIYHVAVLGEPPPAELAERITAILAAGESATLPAALTAALAARRARSIRSGPWTERHFRPGQPL